MGSGESTGRRVSFGMDEDERVRVLRGVKLSEDVLQRIKNAGPASDQRTPKSPTSTVFPDKKEELSKRHEQQGIKQKDLTWTGRCEEEVTGVKAQTQQEKDRSKHLEKQVEQKDLELKAKELFYREQLSQLEKQNEERFRMSAEQFHTAATRSEAGVRPRNTEPVCSGLQAQILHCYRQQREQPLQCSQLARDYMHCINTAKQNLLVNH